LAREHYNASMIIRQNGTEALVNAMNGLQFDPELVYAPPCTMRPVPAPCARFAWH
jgi:hypothetical protein